jgi:hypothetical protein
MPHQQSPSGQQLCLLFDHFGWYRKFQNQVQGHPDTTGAVAWLVSSLHDQNALEHVKSKTSLVHHRSSG